MEERERNYGERKKLWRHRERKREYREIRNQREDGLDRDKSNREERKKRRKKERKTKRKKRKKKGRKKGRRGGKCVVSSVAGQRRDRGPDSGRPSKKEEEGGMEGVLLLGDKIMVLMVELEVGDGLGGDGSVDDGCGGD